MAKKFLNIFLVNDQNVFDRAVIFNSNNSNNIEDGRTVENVFVIYKKNV